jgi:hypothetical protein
VALTLRKEIDTGMKWATEGNDIWIQLRNLKKFLRLTKTSLLLLHMHFIDTSEVALDVWLENTYITQGAFN